MTITFLQKGGLLFNRKILLLVPLLLLLVPASLPGVHAALVGEVCLADPLTAIGSATPCPASAPVFDGPVGQQIRIGVFVQGSDALNGFSVTLIADHTVLTPYDADLTGTVLPGTPSIIAKCIQDVIKIGACASTDTVNTLDFVATAGLGQITGSPITGLLFTAIYNITGTVPTGGIPLGFQVGCSGTSVSPNVCVTIANGSTTADTETAQAGTFDNTNTTPLAFVAVSASPTSFGPEFPGAANTATITATAKNSYPGLATDSVDFTTIASTGLSATVSGTNPCATTGSSCTVSLSLTAAAAGNYFVTVFGTYATNDASGNPDTLVGTVTLNVIVDDFGFSISPTTVSFVSGSTGTAIVTLSSLNGFAGTITLSTGITIGSPPLTITYSPNPLTLTGSGSGSSATSTATFSASPTVATTYHATIKATSGARVKTSSTLIVNVAAPTADFTIAASPTTVSTNVGVAGTSTITISPLRSFTGTVALTVAANDPSLVCSLSPTSVTGGSGTSTLSCTGSKAGSFTATVTGTSGSLTHTAAVSFTVASPGPDYTVTDRPTSATVKAGIVATSTILVNATNSFTGSISLTDSASPTGLLCSLSQSTIVLGTSGTSLLSCNGSQGVYTVTVSGSNSTTFSHSTTFSVTVQDFSLTASPTSVTVNANTAGTSTITVAPLQGFADTVNLASSVFPATGLACTLTPTSIPGGSGSSTLSCLGAAGSYLANVTGTDGSLSHSIIVNFTVQDFTISASPTLISFATGGSGTSTVTVTSLFTFSGTVSLSVSASDLSLNAGLSPISVTGGSGSSTLTVSGSTGGSFSVNVTGVSGSLKHSVIVQIRVALIPDFSVNANPTSVNVNVGSSAASTITVSALNGFVGNVTLSDAISPTGLTCTLSVATVKLTSTVTSGTSGLSCSGPVGIYTVTVAGTNTTVTHSATVTVRIQDFTISANPTSININAGDSSHSTITVTGLGGFAGLVTLSKVPSSGLIVTLGSTSVSGSGLVTLTVTAALAGDYSVNVTGSSGSITHTASEIVVTVVDFTITSTPSTIGPVDVDLNGNSTILISAVNGFSGTVTLTVSAPSGLTTTLNQTSVTGHGAVLLKVTGAGAANYAVGITATNGTLTHTITINVIVVSYSLTLSQNAITISEGSFGSLQLTVSSMNGFSGPISLSYVTPSGTSPTLTFGNSVLLLKSGGSNSTTVTINVAHNVIPNLFKLNVTGTDGLRPLTAGFFVDVPAPTFTIVSAPPSVIGPGATGTVKVTVTSVAGLSGLVSLSVNPPSPALKCTLSLTSVDLTHSGSNATMVSCSGSPGSYNVTITGQGTTPLPQTVTVIGYVGFSVADFTVTSTPTGILVNPDQSGHAMITLSWTAHFNGTVNFVAIPTSGLNATLSPASITGSGSVTLNVISNTPGTYSVVVNATSGSSSHTVTLTVTVSPVNGAASILGLDPTTFYSLIGVLIVAAVAGIVLVARRGKRPKK